MKFVTIEGSTSYDKLKALPPFVKSQNVLLESLFTSVKTELSQVSEDMQSVHKIIESDIKSETEQMTKLDERLRDSAKKINHIYMKNLRFRNKYGTSTHGSKRFQMTKDNVIELEERIGHINKVKDEILNKFIEVDRKLRKNQRLLLPDSINERHYPTLFTLLKKQYPTLFECTPEEIKQDKGDTNYIEALGRIDLHRDVPNYPHHDIEREHSDIPNISTESNTNYNSCIGDTEPKNDNIMAYTDLGDIDIPDVKSNDITNKNDSILDNTISSKESSTSMLTVKDRDRIKVSLSNPFVLGSFKKPSSAKTLTTTKNISASDITSAHLSNQDSKNVQFSI
ncbi:similar to Saccharomyces cerevisiae YEL005C VAB2 Protein with a potential role in vacuolar function, as suggested by its ability to bind Vac8p [Maudiozyma saulgeensis]|uniref:Similar to Saccharomyces cerevisiae YEL005C VAB2 Protein with a potential role in vacuolar function, as suggested by its ability to bind Vac8p n=1 Tax=Maudiozyma saulgeensis TaxID=1789683 RepID=A0A1X7R3F1_9SACH|nr:similar to Saccharomyces cerevisiae YEL005C VAB2 Protein with a potential role in vacuolar function, as suggested by its ability to bind Vac8p [Kazachstania saulgeensis]